MRMLRLLSGLSAAFCLAVTPAAWGAERVPPALAAKRAGPPAAASADAPFATPTPLNLIYTLIQPCRAFGAQALATGQTKDFQITGNGNFASQGGSAAGCGVPPYAKAVSINLSANASPSGGYLTAFAFGAPRPGIGSLNMASNTSNTAGSIVALGSTGRIAVYGSRATNVFGDVTGYFEAQLWAYVSSSGTLLDSSGRIASVSRTSAGLYTVIFDRNISSCAGTASSDITGHIMSVYTTGTTAYVYSVNNAGAAEDYWFNLHVKC